MMRVSSCFFCPNYLHAHEYRKAIVNPCSAFSAPVQAKITLPPDKQEIVKANHFFSDFTSEE